MLTTATKKKIDTARDILVGKIPVPTSQVEQITLALIYKFMSDMDKKAKELGDSSGFFANGYEKYAWGKLMDKALPARDRVLLYREALEKMSLNPHIPQLFRDVFRDASLPFNDPETLKLFLDVIDQFEYDHSEELGNAFEYLLQVMGSQGDAGQFRTPRHIIDFIVEVVEPKKTDKILDPACGTAGFLISAYNYLKTNGLSSDEMSQVSENFVGYDISQDMQRLSLVNMYLHHFPNPHIYEYDTLTSEDRWNDDFDVILANPPFMTPKGGIRPHNRFSVPSTRAEVLFIDYIMEHLTTNGKAGVIVPEGIIFQSQNAYKNLRKMMVDGKYLWAVVSLPSGIFQPYSGVKTSILLFDKEIAKKTDHILFVNIQQDGFDLGAQRRVSIQNDLPLALEALTLYKKHVMSGNSYSKTGWPEGEFAIDTHPNCDFISKKEISENGDYNLSSKRYASNEVNSEITGSWPMVKLETVCEINPKKKQISHLSEKTEVTFLPMSDIEENKIYVEAKQSRNLHEVMQNSYTYFANGDVLLAKVTPCFENGKASIAINLKNNIGFGSSEYIVFRPSEKILPEFLYRFITSTEFRQSGKLQMTGTGGLQRIPMSFVKTYKIPLPPLAVQQEIVNELYPYQRIIDGARQIIENYKPSFKIGKAWKWVTLGEVCKIGGVITKTSDPQLPYIGADSIESNTGVLLKKDSAEKQGTSGPVYSFTGKKLLYSKIRPYLNKLCLVDFQGYCSSDMYPLQINDVSYEFAAYYMLSSNFLDAIKPFYDRACIPKINRKQLFSVPFPIPNPDEQNEIVFSIKRDEEVIRLNKDLISKYELLIKEKLDEILD